MESKSVWKLSRMTTHTLIVCGVLAFAATAVAQSNSEGGNGGRCSNRTLSGDYACSTQGFLLNVPIPGVPPQATFVGITMNHYDMWSLTAHPSIKVGRQPAELTPSIRIALELPWSLLPIARFR